MYKVPHSPPLGGGEFIKSFGEEFQVVKRGREFKGFWEEYHVEKRVRGNNIICSIVLYCIVLYNLFIIKTEQNTTIITQYMKNNIDLFCRSGAKFAIKRF